jgi:hypothetical protein
MNTQNMLFQNLIATKFTGTLSALVFFHIAMNKIGVSLEIASTKCGIVTNLTFKKFLVFCLAAILTLFKTAENVHRRLGQVI